MLNSSDYAKNYASTIGKSLEATTHLLIKESLHASDTSEPHRIGLRYTCSIPYSVTINMYSRKYQCRNEKENSPILGQKGTITSGLHS